MRAEPYITSIEPTPRLVEQHLGLEQLELEAHRPQLVAQQEIGVAERQAIGRVARLRGFGRRGFGEAGFLLRAVELAVLEVAFAPASGLSVSVTHLSHATAAHLGTARPRWEADRPESWMPREDSNLD